MIALSLNMGVPSLPKQRQTVHVHAKRTTYRVNERIRTVARLDN